MLLIEKIKNVIQKIESVVFISTNILSGKPFIFLFLDSPVVDSEGRGEDYMLGQVSNMSEDKQLILINKLHKYLRNTTK